MEKIKLNENITIYKLKYDWSISKNNILEKAIETCIPDNKTLLGNTYKIVLKCRELDEIHKIGIDICKSLTNVIDEDYVSTNFIYKQTNDTVHAIPKIYHNHTYDEYNNKCVLNDWAYCFYLQLPKNNNDNESKLAFKDRDNNVVYYLPEEGDFIVFDADLEHAPEATKNAECDRYVIVGTVSFNVNEKIKLTNKNII